MTGLGTIVNMAAIFLGCSVGLLIRGGLPERFQKIITSAIGLATIFIGISGAMTGMLSVTDTKLVTANTMVMIFSLIIGAVIGEAIDIEKRLETFGEWCRRKMTAGKGKDASFTEAFVTSTLLYCVGAMAIVGSLNDGLLHDCSVLFAKSVLDGIMAVVFGASLGAGVYLSIFSVAVYQGGITVLSGLIRPYLSDTLIGRQSFVGSILIFAIGINFLFGKKIKLGNLMPAMFVPILLDFFIP
jgi:uncharacterized membrane protein YqgA involved in biofilm formation